MKNKSKIVLLLLTILAFTGNMKVTGQIEEIGNMMAAGADDAKKLIQPYITPAVNAFGAALGNGWYNTAEPHKLGGFDITFTLNTAFVPKKYENFSIDNSNLSFLKLEDPSLNESPTISGEKTEGPQIVYNVMDENNNVVYTQPAFRMPQGLNAGFVPAPMVQAGIGLIKGTDVMFRYMPNIKYKDNEFGLWGIGGRHDIKQWIPGVKRLPVFKMSIMYGFTKLHTFVEMDITKSSIGAGSLPGEETNTWEDQFMKVYVRSQTANLLFGADLKIVSFYGGLGFVTTKTDLKLEGEFPAVHVAQGDLAPSVYAMADPISMEIKNQDGGVTKPRFNAGVRFKLAIVTIHFDYSWANYSVLTGGLGFSFR